MEDQQVNDVDAEFDGGLVEGVERLVVAVVADPDLGLDEHLVTGEPGATHGFTDLPLVAVGRRGVDVPVTDLEGREHGVDGLDRWRLEDAEADDGDLHTVVQGVGGVEVVSHWFLLDVRFSVQSLSTAADTRRTDTTAAATMRTLAMAKATT